MMTAAITSSTKSEPVRVDGATEADKHDAGQAAQRAHHHQRLQPHAAGRDAGKTRRFRIAADRLDAVAEAGRCSTTCITIASATNTIADEGQPPNSLVERS